MVSGSTWILAVDSQVSTNIEQGHWDGFRLESAPQRTHRASNKKGVWKFLSGHTPAGIGVFNYLLCPIPVSPKSQKAEVYFNLTETLMC